jgi:glycosyltransferase involved in cell wall biosynthesis
VVLATDLYLPRRGGIERQVAGLGRTLRAAGHTATVLTAMPDAHDPQLPVRVVPALRLGPSSFDPRLVGRITDALGRLRPDVVHAHASNLTPFPWAAVSAAQRLGVPALITLHSLPGQYARLWRAVDLVLGIGRRPCLLTAVSRAVAREARLFAPRADIELLPNGIDPFPATANAPEPGRLRCLSAMRFAYRKQPLRVLEVLAGLREELPTHTVTATVAGEGTLARRMRRRVSALRLEGVRLPGWLSRAELEVELGRADLFLHTAEREACGLVLLEACSAGVPVVAWDAGGPAELLAGGAGLLAASCAGLVAQAARLAREPELRSELAERGRELAGRHTWERVLPRVLEAYRAAGEAAPPRP